MAACGHLSPEGMEAALCQLLMELNYWQRKMTAAVLNSLPQHPALHRPFLYSPLSPLSPRAASSASTSWYRSGDTQHDAQLAPEWDGARPAALPLLPWALAP